MRRDTENNLIKVKKFKDIDLNDVFLTRSKLITLGLKNGFIENMSKRPLFLIMMIAPL